jgi:putative peptide zinc metalloprotease protein
MADSLFSSSWYRVRALKPRLRSHVEIHRHQYRGEDWYVLQDEARDRFYRFRPVAGFVLGLMNGERTADELWRQAVESLGDDAPTQDELIHLLGQLHAADVLQADVSPDAAELFARGQRQERQQLASKLLRPFAIRIPLIDPEAFLTRTLPYVAPLLGRAGLLLWLAVVLPALVLVGVHWSELSENFLDRILVPQNLVLVWLVFPVMKLFHEFGHGYMARRFGGEIHDMGIMLLIFTPIPYVDASSSWKLRSKTERALIGAGGMLIEIFLAALAFYVWLAAEPGTVRVVAYNALIIGGVTTLLFNANPLLRFDGYYILSDLAEIPNLATRANKYAGYLIERHAFGRDAQAPHTARGERFWLPTYAVAAFAYRIFIVVAISIWIMDQFLLLGLILAAFALIGWVAIPLSKGLTHLFAGPQLRDVRGRALAVVGGSAVAIVLLLTLVPVPLRTQAEGVVWLPDEALVRARTAGFITRVAAEPGRRVEAGTLLVELSDPLLATRERRLEARVEEVAARLAAARTLDRAEAGLFDEELALARSELARAREQLAGLRLESASPGVFVIPRSDHLPGRWVRKGQLIGWVVDVQTVLVRAVVPQDDVDLVRQRTEAVQVRRAEALPDVRPALLRRIVPAASAQLPSRALGSGGGGELTVDPRVAAADQAVESVFEVELEVERSDAPSFPGGRVYVRFEHGSEPLAVQWWRRVRQVFLSRFNA